MRSIKVRPADPELSAALRLAGIFAAALFVFHLCANLWQSHHGWGYFRDEFYYIACGRHLAWGYVDHGPLVAVQARLAETLFGHSLAGIRALSALAGSGRLFLTGLPAWALGGRRPAQSLAMFGVACAPQYLALDGFLSMNSAESLFWMTALLAVILISGKELRVPPASQQYRNAWDVSPQANPRWWLLFGLAAGLGLLNKPSMTFFLVALLVALLLTPQRRILATPWAAAGVALMLLIVAPNLIWQAHNHWPTWEFLHNGRIQHKNKELPPLAFISTQIMTLEPASILVWGAGLIFLLRRRALRFLGLTYLIFFAIMLALHAKDYYVTPIYPILFAAGGIAWEQRFATRKLVQRGSAFAFPAAILTLLLISIAVLPMDTPILTPQSWIAYARATHQYNAGSNSENSESGPLPQFYADRFGWDEDVAEVRRIYRSLTPAEQAQTAILCTNYGQAGALQFLAPELPSVISGHNNYYLWGPGQRPANILIDFENESPEHFLQYYDSAQEAGHTSNPYSMPYERRRIWLLKGAHQTMQSLWPTEKHYD